MTFAHDVGTIEQVLDPVTIELIHSDDMLHCSPQTPIRKSTVASIVLARNGGEEEDARHVRTPD
jgi:hypothetical protein